MNYSKYAIERGLASEAAVEKALERMKGQCLMEKKKKCTLMRKILNIFHAKANDEIDRNHADFIVEVESDVRDSIPIPLQTKSSLRGGLSFERKCRRYGWGPIQVIVVEDSDTDESVFQKVKKALIQGYNIVRREISRRLWSSRVTVVQRRDEEDHPRRRHKERGQWCPRINLARMCAH